MKPTSIYSYQLNFQRNTTSEDRVSQQLGRANRALDMAEEGMTIDEICEQLDISKQTLNKAINVLSEENQILYHYYLKGHNSEKTPKKPKSVPKGRFMNIVTPYCKNKK